MKNIFLLLIIGMTQAFSVNNIFLFDGYPKYKKVKFIVNPMQHYDVLEIPVGIEQIDINYYGENPFSVQLFNQNGEMIIGNNTREWRSGTSIREEYKIRHHNMHIVMGKSNFDECVFIDKVLEPVTLKIFSHEKIELELVFSWMDYGKLQKELDRNRELWKSKSVNEYMIETGLSLNAPIFVNLHLHIKANKIVRTKYAPFSKSGRTSTSRLPKLTIEDYFNMIQRGIDRKEIITVEYNSEYGYPISIDKSASSPIGDGDGCLPMAGTEQTYYVSKFLKLK